MKSILGIIEELISKLTELDEIMFEKFFPDEYLGSTYKIPFEKLYEQGYRGVIFDIDNTLVPHGAPADERAKRLFQRLREIGFESCLLSNNHKITACRSLMAIFETIKIISVILRCTPRIRCVMDNNPIHMVNCCPWSGIRIYI